MLSNVKTKTLKVTELLNVFQACKIEPDVFKFDDKVFEIIELVA